MPERVALNGAKRYALMNPPFSAADAPLFRRALSVGVTFLDADAAVVHPEVIQSVLSSLFPEK